MCREAAQRIMGPAAVNTSEACGLHHVIRNISGRMFLQRCVEVICFVSFSFFYLEPGDIQEVLLLLKSQILFRSIWVICQADFYLKI